MILTLRTTEPTVTLTVVLGVDDGWEEAQVHADLVPVDGHLRVELGDLEADSVHRYVFHTADGSRRSRPGRFRTTNEAARKIVFGASSCLGTENPQFPGLGLAAEEDLDFFVLIGDLVYADGAVSLADYRAIWDQQFAVETVRALTASTSLVATWDDHEVGNNWTEGQPAFGQAVVTAPQVADATVAFLEAVPQRLDGGRMWRSVRWGDVIELFVLDCRGERDWDQHIVSEEQISWVVEQLHASAATFKIVLASVHVTDHTALIATVEEKDRWQGYPEQRDRLLAAAEEVPGVLFITGDMHYGAIQNIGAAGDPGEGLWEVAAGPSGSELFPINGFAALIGAMPPQYVDVVEDWNWARFEVDPGLREIKVQLIDDRGDVAAERVIGFPS